MLNVVELQTPPGFDDTSCVGVELEQNVVVRSCDCKRNIALFAVYYLAPLYSTKVENVCTSHRVKIALALDGDAFIQLLINAPYYEVAGDRLPIPSL
ncbi:hypothetical protein PoB_002161800 [Plakobranchus ocellatus]|uniref:Uncharacterized protein n=1 Tax=Plakobranchus ocellatus TaxID=259542 RepID=A0AAV3ZKL6_9GAST|nr:hypothetical protein PoB_002161800 [Plakobranchus ocellatus]